MERFGARTGLWIGLSFVAGVLLTLGFKDVYPELEARFRRRQRRLSATGVRQRAVDLKDNTASARASAAALDQPIPEGIEACIGDTPLFKIKSLSDATGCEILAKAEVNRDLLKPFPIALGG